MRPLSFVQPRVDVMATVELAKALYQFQGSQQVA